MKKYLVIVYPDRPAEAVEIPPSVVGNTTFEKHFQYVFKNLLKGYEAVDCKRAYENGSTYHYPVKDWDHNPMCRSTCKEYILTVKPITKPTTAKETTMTQFTGVKEQMKHEIFGTDINTASKDQLIELAAFINKKIAAAQGLNLSTSLYVRKEIASLEKLLAVTVAKLDEGVEV